MFNQYPYLNLNDLNLDYILNEIKSMYNDVTNFVSINAIKYADPIQWNITSQYEKNTVVIDPLTGTAYISVAAVPSGVALTRTEYWTVVFDLGAFVTRAAQNFTSRWEENTTLTATFASNTGDWLVWGDVLYKALANITAGDTYVVGGNIEHFTIEDLYNAYLNTIDTILSIVGDLDDLTTSDKTSIVNAINDVVGTIGDLSTLRTVNTSTIVGSINSIAYAVNVLSLGCDNTGITNNHDMLDHLPAGVYYFPDGDYLIEGRINLDQEVTLIGQSRNARLLFETIDASNIFITANCKMSNLSIINEIMTTTVFGAIESTAPVHFDNLYVETNSLYRGAIMVNGAYQNRYVITNSEINANANNGNFGIWCGTLGGASNVCVLSIDDCYIHGFNLNGIFSSARVGRYLNNRIRQCHWQTIPTGGGQIDVLSSSTEIAIHYICNNIIEDPGTGATGIETYECKAIIVGNTIYGDLSNSLNTGITSQDSSQDIIDNNLFQGCYGGIVIVSGASATITNNDFYAMGVYGCIRINGDTANSNTIKDNRNYLSQPLITYASSVIPLYYVEGANTMQQFGIVSNGSITFKLPYAPNDQCDSYFIVVYFLNEIDIYLLGNDNSIQHDTSKHTSLTVTRSGQDVTFTSTHASTTLLAVKLL